ncbi:hypothetical protein JXA02_08780 [candidate division KSB1 bacterium]|nr:hypothetical protein [candidate division KSB1 bacterium]RQW05064.1 MAG: hypothetical protein EH222_10360 [candidate division KSB1 bacterium]
MISCCLFLSLLLLPACDNPFGEDEIEGENRVLSGVVSLPGMQNAKGVYVWLDGVNVGAFTDESGAFRLTLPPRSALKAAGTVTGDLDLYFYTINHLLVVKKVILRDGAVLYGSGDVDRNGEIKNVSLPKSFSVETRAVYPLPHETGYQSGLSMTAHFIASLEGTKISIPNGSMILLGGCFVINVETDEVYLYQLPGTGAPFIASLGWREQQWSFYPSSGDEILYWTPYRVIPFIFPYYPDLPKELLQSIGVSETTISEKYLNILFSGEFGQFERPEER